MRCEFIYSGMTREYARDLRRRVAEQINDHLDERRDWQRLSDDERLGVEMRGAILAGQLRAVREVLCRPAILA